MITESSSSESSFDFDEDDGDSTFSQDARSSIQDADIKDGSIQGILEPLTKINLSDARVAKQKLTMGQDDGLVDSEDDTKENEAVNVRIPKPLSSSQKPHRYSQRGLDSLSFDSDSDSYSVSDSDSSFEIPKAVFSPKQQASFRNADDDSYSSSSSDGDSSDSFQSAREELSCTSDESGEGEVEERGRWKYDKDRKEVSLSSNDEVEMPQFAIPRKLFKTLFDYQKEGVAWMAGLHHGRIGGLLGDDMGLGKTYQVLAFLGGMMRGGTIKNALVVAPLSVLRSWEREAIKVAKACAPHLRIQVVSSDVSKAVRYRRLQEALEW